MTYALSYDVPADEKMYREVQALIGDEPPKGLVVNLVVHTDGGLRHIGVWNSEADWQRFHTERVEPAVHTALRAVGFSEMPPAPPVQELQFVDIWLGS